MLSKDVRNWSISWTDALRSALDNLRQRTRRLEASSVFQKRWEHHPSGCGSTLWRDRYDAARCALLPSVVARRKREDGQPEPGAHVCVFAARGLALGSTSKTPWIMLFGDVVHTKIKPTGDMLSAQAYRLVKVKTGAWQKAPPGAEGRRGRDLEVAALRARGLVGRVLYSRPRRTRSKPC